MSYDATSEPNEFVAETRDEAVAKAVRFFGVEAAELRVREPEDVFGLGARVVVVAVPKSVKPRRPSSNDSDRGGERERGRSRERGGRERGGRDRGRGRDRDRGSRPEGRREAPAKEDEAAVPVARDVVGPVASTGTAVGDATAIGEYVRGIVERMQLGDFQITESEEDELQVIQLEGPAVDRLAADDRTVGALQLLANQAAMRSDEDPKRVVIDCEGDSDQRESFLERQAGRAARRAVETGRSVALDPVNARDRRALHMAVRDIEGVVTMSIGTGRYRQVVIVPEGAAEYDEAVAAAREAAKRAEERDGDR